MPCRGRPEQTVRNVRRLLATAGLTHGADWTLYLVGSAREHADITATASQIATELHQSVVIASSNTERLTYWQALAMITARIDAPLIANLANDLLPGQHWLQRAYSAYRETFGDSPGMVGFNDGHHETGHSCHFLISRSLLDRYGGWPMQYDHAFGDTELCERAIADGLYAKAPWATLFHDHPYFGGTDDGVYAEGRAQVERDGQLYEQRRMAGWPTISR